MDNQESYVRKLYAIMAEANPAEYDNFLEELNEMEDDYAATILMRGFCVTIKHKKLII